MKRLRFLVVAAALCIAAAGRAQQVAGDVSSFKKILTENHYQPRVIDNVFSRDVFDRAIQLLDPEKLYLTAEDLQALAPFQLSIDEEWNTGGKEFTSRLTAVLGAALVRADRFLRQAGREKINWQLAEQLSRGKKLLPSKNDAELKARWSLWIKFKTLEEIASRIVTDSPRSAVTLGAVLRDEKENVRKAIENEGRTLRMMTAYPGGLENKVIAVYLKSIATAFDPHSLYLSPVESENFLGAVASQSYSFGMELHEDDNGDITIERLVPGGPAWKSGELHTGDRLFSMKPDNLLVIGLEGIGIDSLGGLLEENNHLAIELTIKRPNGERKTVYLRKEKMEDETSIVKGYILHGKNKVGYISLPGFYSEWGSEGGSSCANDMARQILKMKKENITALIVDIRSNGGGSVMEAIELAGIFIDEGPLAIFRNKSGVITTLKDVNRGTIYDGPLALLVDGRSASASEMLAAALQDYHRAVVIGAPTFGKATSQRVFSLDPFNPSPQIDPDRKPEHGFATVTIEKIYRVTGRSVQGNGVLPDVLLPGVYDGVLAQEAGEPGALPADSVTPKIPFKARPPLPLALLRSKSGERVARSAWFTAVRQTNHELTAAIKKENEFIVLDWNRYLNSPLMATTAAAPAHTHAIERITPPGFDAMRKSGEKENNDRWIRNLMSDEYVAEAFQLLDDYLSIKK